MPNRLTGMAFDEVSLVRRGANQHADVVLFKMDNEEDASVECPECGEVVTPDEDGSCPECGAKLSVSKGCDHRAMGKDDAKCPTCGAAQEPHMRNPGKGRKVTKSFRERVLDIVKGSPTSTDVHVDGPSKKVTDEVDDDEDPLGGKVYVRPPGRGVQKSSDDGDRSKEKPMLKSDLPEAIAKHIDGDDDTEVSAEAFAAAVTKRDEEVADFIVKSAEPVEKTDEPDELTKAMENPVVREAIEKAQADAAAAIEIAKAERESRVSAEFIEKAGEFDSLPGDAAVLGPVLKRLHEASAEDYVVITDLLKSANAAASMLYKAVGQDAPSSMEGQSADAIEKAAVEIRKEHPEMTPEQAYDAALQANPDLYAATLED